MLVTWGRPITAKALLSCCANDGAASVDKIAELPETAETALAYLILNATTTPFWSRCRPGAAVTEAVLTAAADTFTACARDDVNTVWAAELNVSTVYPPRLTAAVTAKMPAGGGWRENDTGAGLFAGEGAAPAGDAPALRLNPAPTPAPAAANRQTMATSR